MVKSEKIYSFPEFCEEFLGFTPKYQGLENEYRTLLDKQGYVNLWDYPLSEIDHTVENELNVVLVNTSYTDENAHELVNEYRWIEIPCNEE